MKLWGLFCICAKKKICSFRTSNTASTATFGDFQNLWQPFKTGVDALQSLTDLNCFSFMCNKSLKSLSVIIKSVLLLFRSVALNVDLLLNILQ